MFPENDGRQCPVTQAGTILKDWMITVASTFWDHSQDLHLLLAVLNHQNYENEDRHSHLFRLPDMWTSTLRMFNTLLRIWRLTSICPKVSIWRKLQCKSDPVLILDSWFCFQRRCSWLRFFFTWTILDLVNICLQNKSNLGLICIFDHFITTYCSPQISIWELY